MQHFKGLVGLGLVVGAVVLLSMVPPAMAAKEALDQSLFPPRPAKDMPEFYQRMDSIKRALHEGHPASALEYALRMASYNRQQQPLTFEAMLEIFYGMHKWDQYVPLCHRLLREVTSEKTDIPHREPVIAGGYLRLALFHSNWQDLYAGGFPRSATLALGCAQQVLAKYADMPLDVDNCVKTARAGEVAALIAVQYEPAETALPQLAPFITAASSDSILIRRWEVPKENVPEQVKTEELPVGTAALRVIQKRAVEEKAWDPAKTAAAVQELLPKIASPALKARAHLLLAHLYQAQPEGHQKAGQEIQQAEELSGQAPTPEAKQIKEEVKTLQGELGKEKK